MTDLTCSNSAVLHQAENVAEGVILTKGTIEMEKWKILLHRKEWISTFRRACSSNGDP